MEQRLPPALLALLAQPVLLAQAALTLTLCLAVRRFASAFTRRLSGRRHQANQAISVPTATPTAPPLRCLSGVPQLPYASLLKGSHAWGYVFWNTMRLRDGPDYRRNKIKRPASPPLLPCVGFDAFRTSRKLFTDCSEAQAACLPPEVLAAAREASPGPTELPRFLLVSVNMPTYSGPAADGPTLKFVVYFAVPPALAHDASGAARLLVQFLRTVKTGHRTRASAFYDRFKVIARMVTEDAHSTNPFLRLMIDHFNGKPMLWRFFGVWGDCGARGAVATVNLDFCTGGRVKNAALAQCTRTFDGFVGDMSWLLESREDAEMPERLIGGVTIVRIDLGTLPLLREDAAGSVRVVRAAAPRADKARADQARAPGARARPAAGRRLVWQGWRVLALRWLAIAAVTGALCAIEWPRLAPSTSPVSSPPPRSRARASWWRLARPPWQRRPRPEEPCAAEGQQLLRRLAKDW